LAPGGKKQMIKKDEVLDFIKSHDTDVLVILGAGDLDNYVPEITKIIETR
jgi:UDP-N-acetylmuramate--alanine ligase